MPEFWENTASSQLKVLVYVNYPKHMPALKKDTQLGSFMNYGDTYEGCVYKQIKYPLSAYITSLMEVLEELE